MVKTVAFYTLGCKLNYAETSEMERQFRFAGYTVVDFKSAADVYVVNTCTVTAIAEKKGRTAIRSAIARNPNAFVAVVGCFAQIAPEVVSAIEGVNLVLGNSNKHQLLSYVESLSNRNGVFPSVCNVDALFQKESFAPSHSEGSRTRTFLKIQDGCEYFCSYCAIPFARGRNRSRSIAETVNEAKRIGEKGIKEIVLTGVNIGEFGCDQSETFFDLLQALDTVEGVERYRISSIEPNLISRDMIRFIARSQKFLPHFHIPLQSGSDLVLQRMKRRYTTGLFSDKIQDIKSLMPHAFLAADVMVGFPGETEAEFEQMYRFLNDLPLSELHVFPYSERPNTLALHFDGKIAMQCRRQRSQTLNALSKDKKNAFYRSQIGSTHHVLWESDGESEQMFGFTENYIRTQIPFCNSYANQIMPVVLEKIQPNGIFSVLLAKNTPA